MAAVEGFVERTGLVVTLQAVKDGLAGVNWLGRLEILDRKPYVIVDGAMNGDSAEKLIQALQRYFPAQLITFIFGASSDHPIHDMLAALLPHAARMFTVASRHPRAEKAERLTALAEAMGYQTTPMPDVASALEQALAGAGQTDLICVTGSLFLVADVREAWLRRNGLPLPPLDPLVVS